MKNKLLRLAAIFVMLGILSSLFGCKKDKEPDYPFDTEKAYYMSRGGIMAGGRYEIKTEPEGIVEVYSYVNPVLEGEDGMRDKGASIFFVGIKPGETTVTASEHYPTCPPDEYSFVLSVSEDLVVTKKDAE